MMNEASRVVSDAAVMKPRSSAQPRAHKIALYGFGSEPVVHRNLIDLAAKAQSPLTWCAILTMPHYRPVIGEVLPAGEILDVFHARRSAAILDVLLTTAAAWSRTSRRRNGPAGKETDDGD